MSGFLNYCENLHPLFFFSISVRKCLCMNAQFSQILEGKLVYVDEIGCLGNI
ncbi:hypothetical protein ANACOL_00512 [Anaerotruncus colihominis DSM 17241]|uniref:Uncharacterized protein n=1 Tax=Anaerotruncus colihominis DSM 17241 TaxID=445972 RepID=B0P6Y4_9FIRM|nr:hypothetical protein ANACOL_00512 [Anaerotruncus colihominis DSM 17241]